MKEDNMASELTPEEYREKYINLIEELDQKFRITQKNLSQYLTIKGHSGYSETTVSNLGKEGKEGKIHQYETVFREVDLLKKKMGEKNSSLGDKEWFGKILAEAKEEKGASIMEEDSTYCEEEESNLQKEQNEEQSMGTKNQLSSASHKQNRPKQEPQVMSRLFKILVGVLFLWLFSLSAILYFQWLNRTPEQKTILLCPQGGENSPWVDSGIEVAPGDEIKIEAFGKINLAFHHMLEAAMGDTLPTHAWTGPQGELETDIVKRLENKYNSKSSSTEQEQDILKKEKEKLRDRNEKRLGVKIPSRWGEILWCVAQEEPRDVPDSLAIRTYSEGIDKDSNKIRFLECRRRGRLFLSVSDIWLYNHKDYLDEAQYKTLHLTVEKIKELKNCEYYNLWFDDNAGAFLVTITKK